MEMNETADTSINRTIDKEGLKRYLEKIKVIMFEVSKIKYS
jgi:hypothetical protein